MDQLIQISKDGVAATLETNNRDDSDSAIAELGFSTGLWNGDDTFPCSFNVVCGGYSRFVKNSVVLEFPADDRLLEVLPEELIREALVAIVDAFDPEVAVFTSNAFIDRHGGGAPWDAGGWLVYRRADGKAKVKSTKPIGVLK